MAYFTAVLVRAGKEWEARDVDIDGAADLESLADSLRQVAEDGPLLCLIEQEDTWFALIRVDDDDDPQVFVSDPAAASSTKYAELLGVEVTDEDLGTEPIGDFELLADLGTSPGELRALCDGERAVTTGEAITVLAEAGGFADLLDSLR